MTPLVTLLAWGGSATACVPQLPACFRGGGDSGLVRKSARKRLFLTQNNTRGRRQLSTVRGREGRATGFRARQAAMDQRDRMGTLRARLARAPALAARGLVKLYRHALSPLIGFDCRHLPTCSSYADEALDRFGLWAGGWIPLARLAPPPPLRNPGR